MQVALLALATLSRASLVALAHITGKWVPFFPPSLPPCNVRSHCDRLTFYHQQRLGYSASRLSKWCRSPVRQAKGWSSMCLCQYAKTNTALQIITPMFSPCCVCTSTQLFLHAQPSQPSQSYLQLPNSDFGVPPLMHIEGLLHKHSYIPSDSLPALPLEHPSRPLPALRLIHVVVIVLRLASMFLWCTSCLHYTTQILDQSNWTDQSSEAHPINILGRMSMT